MDRLTRTLALATIGGAFALLLSQQSCRRADARTHGVGDRLRPFIVENADTHETYCQVCAFSGRPMIMIAADAGDPALEPELAHIQRSIEQHKDAGLVGFALVASLKDGSLSSASDPAALFARLKAIRKKLALTMPLVTLPAKLTDYEQKNYSRFDEAYTLDGSPTVLFATPEMEIAFAERIESKRQAEQHARLESAIKSVISAAPKAEADLALPARWTELIRTLEVDPLDAVHRKAGGRPRALVDLVPATTQKHASAIAFFATWCPPCLDEMTALEAMNKDGKTVAGVSLDGAANLDATRKLLDQRKVAYPIGVLLPESAKIAGAALDAGLPFLLVLDRSRRVHSIHRGLMTKDELGRALAIAEDVQP